MASWVEFGTETVKKHASVVVVVPRDPPIQYWLSTTEGPQAQLSVDELEWHREGGPSRNKPIDREEVTYRAYIL